MLTKEELVTIKNLLLKGNFGLNAEQSQQVIFPLIFKISKMTIERNVFGMEEVDSEGKQESEVKQEAVEPTQVTW